MDAFDARPLCPAPTELRGDHMPYAGPALIIMARARRHVVRCRACGHASSRVHRRYQRTRTDLPWHGLRVQLVLRVRRFCCDVPGCARRIFTERLPNTAAASARRTPRAASALEEIAFALGGDGPAHGWRRPAGSARGPRRSSHSCAGRQRHQWARRACSASLSGPGEKGSATGPCSSISSATWWSISCRIAKPRPSPRGSRSSVETAAVPCGGRAPGGTRGDPDRRPISSAAESPGRAGARARAAAAGGRLQRRGRVRLSLRAPPVPSAWRVRSGHGPVRGAHALTARGRLAPPDSRCQPQHTAARRSGVRRGALHELSAACGSTAGGWGRCADAHRTRRHGARSVAPHRRAHRAPVLRRRPAPGSRRGTRRYSLPLEQRPGGGPGPSLAADEAHDVRPRRPRAAATTTHARRVGDSRAAPLAAITSSKVAQSHFQTVVDTAE